MRPAMADSISEEIRNLALNAGLPASGAYALRRETGNYVSVWGSVGHARTDKT